MQLHENGQDVWPQNVGVVYNKNKNTVYLVGCKTCVCPTNLFCINSHRTLNFKTGAHQFAIGTINSRPRFRRFPLYIKMAYNRQANALF